MPDLIDALAELALDAVKRPLTGRDPVIRLRSPEQLEQLFAESVGLGLTADEPSHAPELVLAAAQTIVDYSVRTAHPRFLNQNFAGPSPVAVLGDWLAAALNTTNATFEAAPVFTLMERAVLTRLAELAGFPADASAHGYAPGMFTPGGSTATLYALQLARHRKAPDAVHEGDSARWAIFISDQGHYSTRKSAALLGIGTQAVIEVETDAGGAMRADALDRSIAEAVANGRIPLAVVATSGTTVTAAFDPLHELADRCESHGMWLHVDGAWGGSALISPAHRHRLDGVERADSLLWNLHKMLGVPQQCSTLLVRDPDPLGPCFAAKADYLFQPDKLHSELDSGDRTFQCARRVDVLKAWLAWKASGESGFAERVEHAVALADRARDQIGHARDLALVVPGDFSNVCFTWVPPTMRPLDLQALSSEQRGRLHALQPRVKARMQREGTAMIGFQPIDGLNCFRLIFNNPSVTPEDVDTLIELVRGYSEQEWSTL